MLTLFASIALSALPLDEKTVKELAALGQKVRDAESYTYAYRAENSSGPEGRGDDQDADPWTIEVEKKKPSHYVHGNYDFYHAENKFVMKGQGGSWSLVDPSDRARREPPKAGGATKPAGGTTKPAGGTTKPAGGTTKPAGGTTKPAKPGDGSGDGDGEKGDGTRRKREGRPGREGREGKEGKEGKEGRGEGAGDVAGGKGAGKRDPGESKVPPVDRLIQQVNQMQMPHKLLADLDRKCVDATSAEKNGKLYYNATLNPDLIREMIGGGGGPRNRAERKEGGGAGTGGAGGTVGTGGTAGAGGNDKAKIDTDLSGTMRVTVHQGAIEKVELDLMVKAPGGGERKSKVTFDLSHVNATTITPPAEVVGLLGGK